jgi:hypothetical protein
MARLNQALSVCRPMLVVTPHLDFYREASTYQKSDKVYRLGLHGNYRHKIKHKYGFESGNFVMQYEEFLQHCQSPVIKFKGFAFGHLFTDGQQQELLTTGHPALPEGFCNIQEIYKGSIFKDMTKMSK